MPTYHLHLENSTGPSGDIVECDLTNDDAAVREGGIAAAEVLTSEISENQARPYATVTIKRDGAMVAMIRAEISVQRFT